MPNKSHLPKISTRKWPPDAREDTTPSPTPAAVKQGGRRKRKAGPSSSSAAGVEDTDPSSKAAPSTSNGGPFTRGDPIASPSRNDVLCRPASSSVGPCKHHGNVLYRASCREVCDAYAAAPKGRGKGGKREIAASILSTVQSRDPPGRFVKLSEGDGGGKKWYELSDREAMKKISSLLLMSSGGSSYKSDAKRRKRERKVRRDEERRVEEVAEDAIFAAAAAASVASKTKSTKERSGDRLTSIPDPPPSVPISAPTCSDIFSFSAKGACEPHFGSRVYRTLCDKFRAQYREARKGRKFAVVAKVVECVRAQNPSGRFLRRNGEEGVWYEMDEEDVLKKVSILLQKGKGKAQSAVEATEEVETDSSEDDSENEMSEETESRPKKKPEASMINESWPSENADSGSLSWNDMCFRLLLYKAKNRNCDVPEDYTVHDNLGGWVAQQRTYFNNRNTYKPYQIDRVRALNELGLDFCVLQDQWDAMFERLRQFKEREGHVDAPRNLPGLGRWVQTQRALYSEIQRSARRTDRPQQLSQERIDRLEALGLVWRKREKPVYTWEDSFQQLVQFKAEHGHTVVPQHYEPNRHLGEWVTRMRYNKGLWDKGKTNKRAKQMTEERIQTMEGIGFQWKVLCRKGSS